MEFMADRVAKVHPQDSLLRKGTRDTDHYSQAGSCFEEPPRGRQERNPNNTFLGGTEHVLDEAAYCRICLEAQQEGNPLLTACQCRDQIHQECLLEWVEHRMEGANEPERLVCEVCKAEYSVPLQVQFCFTCEISKQRNQKYRGEFTQSLLVLIFFSGLFCLTLGLLVKMATASEFSAELEALLALPKNTIVAILVMGILFLGIFSAGLGYRLVMGYCYGRRWRMSPIGDVAA